MLWQVDIKNHLDCPYKPYTLEFFQWFIDCVGNRKIRRSQWSDSTDGISVRYYDKNNSRKFLASNGSIYYILNGFQPDRLGAYWMFDD